ncbi:MAG: glycosyltransferase family 4 protein [Acutalibacteraceae bacterium]
MEKKKILIYAHYYFPDVASTGQILKELAEGMLDKFDVTVICVVPSYLGTVEEKYKEKRFYRENINGVEVLRIRVPEFSKESTVSRVKNILSYFFGAIRATFKVGKQDYVFSISQPPVLGGLIGVWGKWVKHAKYIYNIQDFNPEQTMAVNYSNNKLILKLMMLLDKFSCKRSNLVITVGRDLVETLNKRFKYKKVPKCAFINNWIDEKEIYPLPPDDENVLEFKRRYNLDNKFVIMYSGNIGLYYDLPKLMNVIKRFRKGTTKSGEYESGCKTSDGREVVFAFVGSGSMLDTLVDYTKRHHFENVVFIPYQEKEDLIYSLNSADVHWCVNAKGIKGVSVPSKCYGVMSAGKPVLGVLEENSEARLIIEETGCGLCCEPGDYDAVARNIEWFVENAGTQEIINMGKNGREYLVKNLTKDISVKKYIDAILEA